MYLLDTCAISDFFKGEAQTIEKLKSINPSLVFIYSISYMELIYGLERNPEKAKKIKPIMDEFLKTITIIDFTVDDAKSAGKIRYLLHQQGLPIGPFDLLIAGIAVNRGFTLVTSNLREFQRAPHLRCENWRKSLI